MEQIPSGHLLGCLGGVNEDDLQSLNVVSELASQVVMFRRHGREPTSHLRQGLRNALTVT